MTPDKAAGATFRFGYAVRYRVASTAEEVTLHDLGRFNVGCVIDSRLRRARGPCREDPPAAPAAPAGPAGDDADAVLEMGPAPPSETEQPQS
jgi:hypothetical protein